MPAPKKNASLITQYVVTFKEVDAVYDLFGESWLTDPPAGQPQGWRQLAAQANPNDASLSAPMVISRWDDGFKDEALAPINDKCKRLPGMYQGNNLSGYGTFCRTFLRDKARNIHNKWVYVFSANDKAGFNLMLMHELYFERGSFKHINLAADKNQGRDSRSPEPTVHSTLLLDAHGPTDGDLCAPRSFFFLLAPFQIPWGRLAELKRTVAARGMRLHDEFWTDAYPMADVTARPSPVLELFRGKEPPGMLGYVVYLLDPAREAIRRANLYDDAVQAGQAKAKELSSEAPYALAKNIQAFINGDEIFRQCVPHLREYLDQTERDWLTLLIRAETTCRDLVNWVGETMKREASRPGFLLRQPGPAADTWVVTRDGSYPSSEQKESQNFYNAFSLMTRDYVGANGDILGNLSVLIADIFSRLEESDQGSTWLKTIGQSVLSKYEVKSRDNGTVDHEIMSVGAEDNVADGGAWLVFGFTSGLARKLDDTAIKSIWLILKAFAKPWTNRYKRAALENFKAFVERTLQVDYTQLRSRSDRRVSEGVYRRRFRRARQLGIAHLAIEPTGVEAFRFAADRVKGSPASGVLPFVQLALESYNLCFAVSELKESHGDAWKVIEAIGSASDAYASAAEVIPKLDELEYDICGFEGVARLASTAVWLSCFCDIVSGSHKVYRGETSGQQAAGFLTAAGASMIAVFSLVPESVLTGVAAVVGLVLQATGSWVDSVSSKAQVFLRHCAWGEPIKTDTVLDTFSDKNELHYKGLLSDLKSNYEAQAECMDELRYDFTTDFVLRKEAGGAQDLFIQATLGKNAPRSPGMIWEITLEMGEDFTKDTWNFLPSEEAGDDEDLSAGKPILVKRYSAPGDPNFNFRAQGWMSVKGKVRLDVGGDGRTIIERDVDATVRFTYSPY